MATLSAALKLHNSVSKTLDVVKKLNEQLMQSGAAAASLLGVTLGGAMAQQKLLDGFIARIGNANVGQAMFERIKSEALAAGQDVNAAMKNALSFMGYTKDVEQLSRLNEFASRMAAFDTSGGGIAKSADALRMAMDGDTSALASMYNIPMPDIEASKIKPLAEAGDMDGFLQAFDILLEKQNMGRQQFDQMMDSPINKVTQLGNRVKSMMADVGTGGLQFIGPIVDRLNELLGSPLVGTFIQSLSLGLQIAGAAAYGLVSAIVWLADMFAYLYEVTEPYLFMIGSAFALWAFTQIPALIAIINAMILRLWVMAEVVLANAAAWLAMNWPILLIGALIGLLIYGLYKWSEATTEVLGYVGGIFGVLFAFLYNRFAYFANIVLSVAEFFVNVWRDPIYAVKKLFFDMVINALSFLNNLAKGVESIINAIPGLHVDLTVGMDNILQQLEAARDNLQSDKDVVHLKRFEQLDHGTAFDMGQDMGKKIGEKATDALHGLVDKAKGMFGSFGGLGGDETVIPTIAKVGEVGKINDTVDISSEDIKMLRELAEMQNIQNFVTLTPTVNVKTGDVNNGYDIDTMISRITVAMEEHIASSAQGVYG